MWLIDTTSLQLKEFHECPAGAYAILSHTWASTDEEPTFEEFKAGNAREKAGYEKIRQCCQQARSDGLQYAWVDTCCIDKHNSTELSEAINSMFSWYQQSQICYAYLADVSNVDAFNPLSPINYTEILGKSRWFTRGWTLQELIAPESILFFSKEWTKIGDKSHLAHILHAVTGINIEVLTAPNSFLDYPIAQRMSWAAYRQTTRLEDCAYCLIGLFDVNLPMMYGEGSKAFLRLQQAIIEQTNNESIFVWTDVPATGSGLLAAHPLNFADAENVQRGGSSRERPTYVNTNKGLLIECQMIPCEMNTYKVPLQCHWTDVDANVGQIAIYLVRTHNDDQYRRVTFKDRSLGHVTRWEASRARLRRVFVPSDGRGLGLAPGKGLPVIQIRSNLQIWHVERVENHILSSGDTGNVPLVFNVDGVLSNSTLLTDDVDSGMPTIIPSRPVVEVSSCAPYEARQVQFHNGDLEKGVLLAIRRDDDPQGEFHHYLQIGFDLDFRPIAVLRKHRFWLDPSRPVAFLRANEFWPTSSSPAPLAFIKRLNSRLFNSKHSGLHLEMLHTLWAPSSSQNVASFLIPMSYFVNANHLKANSGKARRTFFDFFDGSTKVGHRFERMTLDHVSAARWLNRCSYLTTSVHPLGDLAWELRMHKYTKHRSPLFQTTSLCSRCVFDMFFLAGFGWLVIVICTVGIANILISVLTIMMSSSLDLPFKPIGFTFIVLLMSILAVPLIWGYKRLLFYLVHQFHLSTLSWLVPNQ